MQVEVCDRCFAPLVPGQEVVSIQLVTQRGKVDNDGVCRGYGPTADSKYKVCLTCEDIVFRALKKRPRRWQKRPAEQVEQAMESAEENSVEEIEPYQPSGTMLKAEDMERQERIQAAVSGRKVREEKPLSEKRKKRLIRIAAKFEGRKFARHHWERFAEKGDISSGAAKDDL